MGMRVLAIRLVWLVWVVLLIWAIYEVASEYGQLSPVLAYATAALSLLVIVLVGVPAVRSIRAAPPSALTIADIASGVVGVSAFVSIVLALVLHLIGFGTTPPPPSITDVTKPAEFSAVLGYAKGVDYESNTHGTADSALLTDSIGGALHIVKAWIAPARGANFTLFKNLAGIGPGKGRVLARITVDTTGGGRGYPLLNLPSGTSYVWIDSLDLRPKDPKRAFRAFIIPDDPRGAVARYSDTTTFIYLHTRGTFQNFPTARWLIHHSNCYNAKCGNGCCQVCPG
jgi:hypothetical protein